LFANYQSIKAKHAEALKSGAIAEVPLLRYEPHKLDLRVRVIFEENLNTLIFPKVKEFTFRVAKQSPLEVVAKILANKNMHPTKWQDYSFSLISNTECPANNGANQQQKRFEIKETRFENLATPFEAVACQNQSIESLDELILFYSVKDLEQFCHP
jgi:hypothetical protein